jgi:hypothetical protein
LAEMKRAQTILETKKTVVEKRSVFFEMGDYLAFSFFSLPL